MKVRGDYRADGYALVEGLISPEVAEALLGRVEADVAAARKSYADYAQTSPLMRRSTIEISGHFHPSLLTFLWGLTPIVEQLVGRPLLPSYDYFRVYQQGDICRVHSDRPSCEHSLSLTLGSSDGKPWPLEIGSAEVAGPDYLRDSFGDEPFESLPMRPGDAVLYQGVSRRHGRTTPNPNQWSAHLFLHWVDRDGPYRSHAFDAERVSAARAAGAPVV